MREWTDIVAAFDALTATAKRCALATVVRVDGSAYRRAGARMLIAEDGRAWGGVSGGCLERDVIDRARGVIATGQPFLQRYDTSDEELIERGVSTGCGGTIDVLIQPVSVDDPQAVAGLADVVRQRSACRIVTLIHATGIWRVDAGRSFVGEEAASHSAAGLALATATPNLRWQHVAISQGASTASAVVEILSPPQRLVVVGGGPDAAPVVAIAKTLGWHVAVVAARPALSLADRFSAADETYVTGSLSPLDGVAITTECAVVVMTHNLARDAAVLAALTVRPRYLGLLGPRHRTQRVIGPLPPGHPGRFLHSPVGLDIGSESPEEIALSIIAQVQGCIRVADARPHASPADAGLPCPT